MEKCQKEFGWVYILVALRIILVYYTYLTIQSDSSVSTKAMYGKKHNTKQFILKCYMKIWKNTNNYLHT